MQQYFTDNASRSIINTLSARQVGNRDLVALVHGKELGSVLLKVEATRMGDSVGTESEPMKIIHKDQEVMTCFCINQVGSFIIKAQLQPLLQ